MTEQGYWLRGRKPGGKWYDKQCRLDSLTIWLARVAVIALACGIGALSNLIIRDSDAHRYNADQEEMHCTRAGWGGDC